MPNEFCPPTSFFRLPSVVSGRGRRGGRRYIARSLRGHSHGTLPPQKHYIQDGRPPPPPPMMALLSPPNCFSAAPALQ